MAYAHNKVRRLKLKQKLVDLKGGKCERCKESFPNECFDFHHLDHKTKLFSLNGVGLASRRWSVVIEEFNKCVMLCACCHRTVHATNDKRWLHESTDRGH